MQENMPIVAPMNMTGMIRQKQQDYYFLRLKAVAGDLTATQMACIALVAERYGRGVVHFSTRQGIEIHHVHYNNLESARRVLEVSGIQMGASGNTVRVIMACPGESTCKWGLINTKKIATELDRRFFNQETPAKFKMAVTGCANNCTKANTNDIGVRNAIEPQWNQASCFDCKLCAKICPAKAIERYESNTHATNSFNYIINRESCINCGMCTQQCSGKAWGIGKQGYTLFIGGTMGKVPRFGTVLKSMIQSEAELYDLIQKAINCYRKYALKKERFGHMIDRIGIEKVKKEILGVSPMKRMFMETKLRVGNMLEV